MNGSVWLCFAALAATAGLAACGGSVSSAPVALAVESSSFATETVALSGTAGTQQLVTLPRAGGYSGTMLVTFAGTASGVSAGVSAGTSAPTGVPAPSGPDEPLVLVGLTTAANVALSATPAFTFTVPPGATTQSSHRTTQSTRSFRVDFYDSTNPNAGYQAGAACTQSGTTVTCAGSAPPFTLAANATYVFELAIAASAGGGVTLTVPTPAPVTCSPSAVTVLLGQTNIINCSQPGYGGAFIATVPDPSIASVLQSNDLTFNYFTVSGLAVGSTTATLASANGASVIVPITVVQ